MVNKQSGLGAWLGIKRQSASTPPLGERELRVLEVLWQMEELSAQQILDNMPDSEIGLNTIQSTIERLHRKNLLSRKKAGRQYFYRTVVSKTDIISSLLHDIATEIAGGDTAPMISGFLKFLQKESRDD